MMSSKNTVGYCSRLARTLYNFNVTLTGILVHDDTPPIFTLCSGDTLRTYIFPIFVWCALDIPYEHTFPIICSSCSGDTLWTVTLGNFNVTLTEILVLWWCLTSIPSSSTHPFHPSQTIENQVPVNVLFWHINVVMGSGQHCGDFDRKLYFARVFHLISEWSSRKCAS